MSNHDQDDILDTYVNRASGARRGAAISNEGKTRITMYLDNDVLNHFRNVAGAKGRGYQTEINQCLRQVIESKVDDVTVKVGRHIRQKVLAVNRCRKQDLRLTAHHMVVLGTLHANAVQVENEDDSYISYRRTASHPVLWGLAK